MIIEDIKVYDGPLIHKRFAYDYFRNNTLPPHDGWGIYPCYQMLLERVK